LRPLLHFFVSRRRRHTRSKRDWSSDVCSSDLRATAAPRPLEPAQPRSPGPPEPAQPRTPGPPEPAQPCTPGQRGKAEAPAYRAEIGRASCRERAEIAARRQERTATNLDELTPR